MTRIGLLGGMSWGSSAEYYRFANEETRDRLGGLHSADCLLRSVELSEIEKPQRTGQWERAATLLAAEAALLERAGAELLVLCTNTMHKVGTAIADAITIPVVHIAGEAIAAICRDVESAFDRVRLWPLHAGDEEPGRRQTRHPARAVRRRRQHAARARAPG
jgi:aspartate/glutamate racemase